MQTGLVVVVLLLNAALVGVGLYLSAYPKKKAESLATKEEFEDLLKQTAELTRTTKEIEAKISDEVWNRQRRWELKRDVLFDVTKKMSGANDALSFVFATYQSEKIGEKTGTALPEPAKSEKRVQAIEKWSAASTEFDTTVAQVALICSPELTNALRGLMVFMRMISTTTAKDPGEYMKAMPEYLKKTKAIDAMMRKELGIDLEGLAMERSRQVQGGI